MDTVEFGDICEASELNTSERRHRTRQRRTYLDEQQHSEAWIEDDSRDEPDAFDLEEVN